MTRRYLLFASQEYAFEILRPLQVEARARGDEIAWYLDNGIDNALHADERLLRTPAEVKTFAPEAVFVPGNWVPHFFPGVKVQIFHGFGIEKKGHFRIRGWFDLYCTHGPLTTEPFSAMAARDGSFHVHETGWPKTDSLFATQPEPSLRNRFPDPERTLILYAPTFSASLTSAPDLAGEIVRLAENRDWNWLVKFHPKMDRQWVNWFERHQGPRLQVTRNASINPLLQTADIMLTDTSSVAAEFLLLDKPVISYRNARPGPHLLDFDNVEELGRQIETALHPGRELRDAMREYATAMHPYRDGRSSARVLDTTNDFVDREMVATLKSKPLNLWRKLRMRMKSGYFGF